MRVTLVECPKMDRQIFMALVVNFFKTNLETAIVFDLKKSHVGNVIGKRQTLPRSHFAG